MAILAYLVTAGSAFLNALLIIMIMMDATDCGSASQTLAVLGGTIAVLFITSTAAVAVKARKILPSFADRVVLVVFYVVILLASYVVIACGLMVAFNCQKNQGGPKRYSKGTGALPPLVPALPG